MKHWNVDQIPPGDGKSAIVTGTGGIGFEDAFALADAGWNVTLAGRNAAKGNSAAQTIRQACPGATVCFEQLDLASLASISALGQRLRQTQPALDLLINNAAVMAPPKRRTTADGFELQLGTNHLGHFALTAALLPLLLRADRPRVVTISSIAARNATIDFEDLQSDRRYRPMAAYGQSKLANLLFAFELQRVSRAAGWNLTSVAAHPGLCRTDLIVNSFGAFSLPGILRHTLGHVLFQSAAAGALPTLYAATAPEVIEADMSTTDMSAADTSTAATYFGPNRLRETRGSPTRAHIPPAALDPITASRLWALSETLTNCHFT